MDKVLLGWLGFWIGGGILAVPMLAANIEYLAYDELWLAILSPLFIAAAAKTVQGIRRKPLRPLVVVLTIMLAGLWFTPASEFNRGVMRLVFISAGFALGCYLDDDRMARYLYSFLLLGGTLVGIFLIVRIIAERDLLALVSMTDGRRSILNKNNIAYHFCFLTLVFWFTSRVSFGFRVNRSALHMLWTVMKLSMPLCVVVSGSRGAFLTGLALTVVNARSLLKTKRLLALVASALLVYSIFAYYTTDPTKTIFSRLSQRDETLLSVGGRMEIWAALPEIARDHPRIMLFGAGTGAVDYYLGSYVTRVKHSADDIVRKHSHSSYLEWMLSYGVLGSVFGLAALIAIYRQLRRYDHLARDTAGLSLALFWGMSSLTTVTWMHPFSVVFTALVVGLIKHGERLSIDARCLPLRMASAQPNAFDRSVHYPWMVNPHSLGRPDSFAINPRLK